MPEPFQSSSDDAQTAAAIQADVGVEHIADVYAEALLGAAESAGQSDEVMADLDGLVDEVFAQSPQFEAVLSSVRISHDEKCTVIDRVLGGRALPTTVNFLKVLSQHGRLDLLRVIRRQAKRMLDKRRGRIHVRLTAATPFDKALAAKLGDRLQEVLGAEPIVHTRIDPNVIGGMVVRVGDTVYDGSVANQLQQLREQMIDRSAHEIQSRRDRFRDPAGD